ncbi:5-methyltetrahydropteroyltriglutamate--homocysteine S-methyltransferase, partial [Arthrobacter crystallopoietes BAB-32]
MTSKNAFPAATILGYPRIGPNRELKKALEAHWKGQLDEEGLALAARKVQDRTVRRLVQLGLGQDDSSIPADFALYDQVLDTTAALGALPSRFADLAGGDGAVSTAASFILARGDGERAPLELTKWFDTNYHYLVPEIGPETRFAAVAHELAGIIRRQKDRGAVLRPVLVGPVTYLLLAKPEDGAPEGFDPLTRIDDAVAAYVGILAQLAEAGAEWVQLDEPALSTDNGGALAGPGGLVEQVYRKLAEAPVAATAGRHANGRPALLVTTGYGTAGHPSRPGETLAVLAAAGVEAVHADLVRGALPSAESLRAFGGTRFVAGIVDGRNVWRNNLLASLGVLEDLQAQSGAAVSVGTSTSLLHVPHDVAAESALPAHLPAWLAFADQKVREAVDLARGLAE